MPLRRSLPALLLAAILCAYIVYPVLAMLSEAFTLPVSQYRAEAMGWNVDAQPFAAPLRRLFSESNAIASVIRTIEISLCSVLTACAWGTALALLWQRREFPGRKLFAALGFAPILMPPLVGTLAFFRLIGEGGVLWRGETPWLNGFGQVLLMHTYSFGIYAFAFVSAALEDADRSQEEAARNLGASGLRVFFAAVWPTIRPALLASALITFMSSSASFSAPYILDNSAHYLTVDILNDRDDPGMQRAFSLMLAIIALSALPAFLYINRRGSFGSDVAIGKGTARRQLAPSSSAGIAARLICSIFAAIILLAPLAFVVEGASTRPDGTRQNVLNSITSLDADAWASLGRSGWFAFASSLSDIFLALAIALALRKAAGIAVFTVEFCVMLALALPGSTLAVSLLSAFNGPSWLTFGTPFGRTAAILVMAYVIRNLPLAVRPVRAAFQAVGTDLENAAAGLGAQRDRVLWRIILPLIFPSLLAAALICFITAAGEYVASELLYSSETKPVSVAIYGLFRSSSTNAYALAMCLMLASAATIGIARLVRKR